MPNFVSPCTYTTQTPLPTNMTAHQTFLIGTQCLSDNYEKVRGKGDGIPAVTSLFLSLSLCGFTHTQNLEGLLPSTHQDQMRADEFPLLIQAWVLTRMGFLNSCFEIPCAGFRRGSCLQVFVSSPNNSQPKGNHQEGLELRCFRELRVSHFL